MRAWLRCGIVLLPLSVLLLAVPMAPQARGQEFEVVDFDLTPYFNADLICNNGNGLDTSQDSIDWFAFVFLTQSVAESFTPSNGADGLPDDGFFARSDVPPGFQLAYNNDDDGNNARSVYNDTDQFTFNVPPGPYQGIHLFGTCGNGDATVAVTLNYLNLTSAPTAITIRDWFDSITETSSEYYLIDGLDRLYSDGTGYSDESMAAIFGYRIPADPTRMLVSVTVTRTDSSGVMNIFGASGERLHTYVATLGWLGLLALAAVLGGLAVIRLR